MRKILFLCVVFLFVARAAGPAEIVVNGKVGTVIPDAPVLDTSFYKVSDFGISDTIIMGRAIVDAHRTRKQASYTSGVVYSHSDRVASNVTRLAGMRAKLKAWGFKSEEDLLKQSTAADTKIWNGLSKQKRALFEREMWR